MDFSFTFVCVIWHHSTSWNVSKTPINKQVHSIQQEWNDVNLCAMSMSCWYLHGKHPLTEASSRNFQLTKIKRDFLEQNRVEFAVNWPTAINWSKMDWKSGFCWIFRRMVGYLKCAFAGTIPTLHFTLFFMRFFDHFKSNLWNCCCLWGANASRVACNELRARFLL